MVASEQFRPSPLVAVFDHGYGEVSRQVKSRGSIANREAVSRSLQLGVSEQMSRLEKNLNWLATTASVSPFIGLLGTVIGIIRAFQKLGEMDLSDPNPSGFITLWLYSHPPLADRLVFAHSYDPWSKGEAPRYVK